MGEALFHPDITNDGSHLPDSCSYAEYVGNKLYEYVAVIKLIKELATSAEARKSLWDSVLPYLDALQNEPLNRMFAEQARDRASDHVNAINHGSFEDWVNQLGHDWFNYPLPWAEDESAGAWHQRMAEEENARADALEQRADQQRALMLNTIKEYFQSLWEAIETRWRECGILYAVATTATDATFFVGELALGAGLGAGAIKLLKSVKFTVHISIPAVGEALGAAGATGLKVTKDTLISVTAVIGAPGSIMRRITRTYKAGDLDDEFHIKDAHVGGRDEDAQAPIGAKEGKRKRSSGETGAIAEQAARNKLAEDGYSDIRVLQNNSGHGVDVIGRNPQTGAMKIIEVKANSSRLSPLQKMGGPKYTNTQLERATNGIRQWKSMPEGMGKQLDDIKDWLDEDPDIEYEIWRYNIDDAGKASFEGKADWDWSENDPPEEIVYRDDKDKVVKREKFGSSSSARGPPSGSK